MKKSFYIFVSLLMAQSAWAVNASQVLISIYSVAVSTSADCSNPTVVIDNGATARQVDFIANSNLGSSSVANGTYPCVILKMSDVITFTPASTSGSCTGGTQYTIDVCRANGSTYTPLTVSGTVGTYGSTTACTGSQASPVDDKVSLFLSTQSTNSGSGGGQAFTRPASAGTNGFTLNGAFTVSGSATGTFVVNFNNKIDGSGATCDLQPPIFGFR